MRVLVLGAGAVGGYFGGRLLEAGVDVTFLVREQRAARLAENGLTIRSDFGDARLAAPPTMTVSDGAQAFDLILLSCKAYDLESAIEALAPHVGPDTLILPMLNGMRHLDLLDERFGAERVLGGSCYISARLEDDGGIVHLNDVHRLTFGIRFREQAERADAIADAMTTAGFETRFSDDVIQEMWEKWMFLATLAGTTCLTRASLGDMIATGSRDVITSMAEECRSIAAASGEMPRATEWDWLVGQLTRADSMMTASMLADLEQGRRTEADHILGDLLRRRGAVPKNNHSLLRLAYLAIKAAEGRNARDGD